MSTGFCARLDLPTEINKGERNGPGRFNQLLLVGIRAFAFSDQMMIGLAADHGEEKTVMIDATYLKAHRTATNMSVKKGGVDA